MKMTLRAARVNAGKTLQDVSRELDIAISTLSDWEHNPEKLQEWKIEALLRCYGVKREDIRI